MENNNLDLSGGPGAQKEFGLPTQAYVGAGEKNKSLEVTEPLERQVAERIKAQNWTKQNMYIRNHASA
jgi:hypothetical protein